LTQQLFKLKNKDAVLMRFFSVFCLKNRINTASFILIIFLLVSACAAPQSARLAQSPPPNLPAQHNLANVPFFAQQEHQCGPAALAMVLQHVGVQTTPDALTPQLLIPARQGSLQVELLAAARRAGMLAVTTAPTLEAVLAEVAAGNPVIVLQNLSLPISPLWHYAVLIGYDIPAQTVTLHSGVTAHQSMALSTFEHTWARGQHWAITITPPAQLPALASETAVLSAAAALERVDKQAATSAYKSMRTRWPHNANAAIGLGNLAYAQQDFVQAVQYYREATQLDGNAADAWHNLAWAQHALGQRQAAYVAAQRAVEIGGPRAARYTESLEKLRP
jgi:tetratricopeptide (TPR) repeat protein